MNHFSHLSKPVIAVTGSNAKSTVVTLVYEMAKEAGKKVVLAGNIGTPVLDVLPEPLSDLYVLELSSFQLDLIPTLNADVAVLLNISEDHMDRYESFKDYVYSKFQIYDELGIPIEELIAKKGDIVFHAEGGHGYEILDNDTKVIEIKNGPFTGVESDKKLIEE